MADPARPDALGGADPQVRAAGDRAQARLLAESLVERGEVSVPARVDHAESDGGCHGGARAAGAGRRLAGSGRVRVPRSLAGGCAEEAPRKRADHDRAHVRR